MEKLLGSRPILTILMIVGSSPLYLYLISVNFFLALAINRFVTLFFVLSLILLLTGLTILICIKNIERVGFKKVDILRLVIPYYGVYFAYFLAKRFTMDETQLAANPVDISSSNRQGNGLSF